MAATTRQMIQRGLTALEKTPSGRSAGDEGDRADYPWIPRSDWVPPKAVRDAADFGLALRVYNEEARGLSRPGGTEIGVARAVQLSRKKPITPRAAKRMKAYFSRHQKDRNAKGFGDDDKPSAGYVAWLLWGGDAGWRWAESLVARMKQGQKNPLDPGAYEQGFSGGGWRPVYQTDLNIGVHVTNSIDIATIYAVGRAAGVGPLDGEPNCGIVFEIDGSGLALHSEGDGIKLAEDNRGIALSLIMEESGGQLDGASLSEAVRGIVERSEETDEQPDNTWHYAAFKAAGGMDIDTFFQWLDGLDYAELERVVGAAVARGHFDDMDWANAIGQWRYLVPIELTRILAIHAVHPVKLTVAEDWDDLSDESGAVEFSIDDYDVTPELVTLWQNPQLQLFSTTPRAMFHGTDVERGRLSFPQIAPVIRCPWPFGQPTE